MTGQTFKPQPEAPRLAWGSGQVAEHDDKSQDSTCDLAVQEAEKEERPGTTPLIFSAGISTWQFCRHHGLTRLGKMGSLAPTKIAACQQPRNLFFV